MCPYFVDVKYTDIKIKKIVRASTFNRYVNYCPPFSLKCFKFLLKTVPLTPSAFTNYANYYSTDNNNRVGILVALQ